MKKLSTLDKVVLEIALDDFQEGKLKLNEVTRALSKYEQQQYDTSQFRYELKEIMVKKYVKGEYGK